MTKAARLVLQDCRRALQELQSAEPADGGDEPLGSEWRCRWVTVLALLRAVGHVLDKVDTTSNPRLYEASSRAYEQLKASRPEPAIFWGFIEEERNVVLKEYAFRVGARIWSVGGVVSLTGYELSTGRSVQAVVGPYGGAQLNFFSMGPFAGRSQTHVAEEAVEWWQEYLDRLDYECQI